MKDDIKAKWKNLFEGKRKNENLVVLLVLIVIVVVAINFIWNGKNSSNTGNYVNNNLQQNNNLRQVSENTSEDEMEKKLESILSKIEGAGDVKVMLTFSETNTVNPIYDENSKSANTTESDSGGGKRDISEVDSQKQIIYKQNSDGSKEPVTKSISSPKIEGAIITAKGANNADVKANIVQAVEAATGLATHKIQVFKMEEN